MKKQTMQFAVEKKDGVVVKAGNGVVYTPKTNYQAGEMKWFDDSKLIKKNQK